MWDEHFQKLPEKEWDTTLRREVALIGASNGVDPDNISVWQSDRDGSICVRFVILTDEMVGEPVAPIWDHEPVVFCYNSLEHVGFKSPTAFSDRDDFPRNLGHLNPTPSDLPASFCLARPNHQAVYDRFGIRGLTVRLVDWFRDAKTGGLMKEGWHPVPMMEGQGFHIGTFDADVFQNYAFKAGGSGYQTGPSRLLFQGQELQHVVILPKAASVEPIGKSPLKESVLEQQQYMSDTNAATAVPWLFVWSDPAVPIDDPVFGLWNTDADAFAALEPYGLVEAIETGIAKILMADVHSAWAGKNMIVLLVGLWRPKPLLGSIFGLSDNDEARKLEIKAYHLAFDVRSRFEMPKGAVEIREILTHALPTADLYRHMSNVPEIERIAQLGYGALGGELGDHYLRMGITEFAIVDKDTTAPHNLARSDAFVSDIATPKVNIATKQAHELVIGDFPTTVISEDCDVLSLEDAKLDEFIGSSKVLVDATADERVRAKLATYPITEGKCIVRVEVAHAGSLGLVSVSTSNGPDQMDLYYYLIKMGLSEKSVSSWLRDEDRDRKTLEELILGFGCSSVTTRLPKYVLSQHVAAALPTVLKAATDGHETGVALNPLDSENRPEGWKWFPVGAFGKVEGEISDGWEVRAAPGVLNDIASLWNPFPDVEVGGYLYGGIDFVLKRITIIEVSQVRSISSSDFVCLDTSSSWQGEAALLRRTGHRINVVGTWHSHPHGPMAFSSRDRATFDEHRKRDIKYGLPTIVAVAAPEGVRCLMEV